MDAVKFLKEHKRICQIYCHSLTCTECPLEDCNNGLGIPCDTLFNEHPEAVVRVVEEWSKEHPIQTNGEKLKEVFGIKNGIRYYSNGTGTDRGCYMSGDWLDAPYEPPKGEDDGKL